jgi:hypothetical protein
MVKKKTIALKYCGGCNPAFDRLGYVKKIQTAAGDRIEWTTFDNGEWGKILLIQGCNTACLEKNFGFLKQEKVLSIRNNDQGSKEIVKKIIK